MKFDTSSEAHEFIENVFARVGARNKAVLGRAALFLALGEGVPTEFKPKDAKGVTLNDEQVVDDDLRDLVRAALNHRAGRSLDEVGYRQEFRRHFEYGCQRLRQIWAESGNDQARFVSALLKLTGGDIGLTGGVKPAVPSMPVVEVEVNLKVLVDAPEWSINGPGTSNGLLVISGQPGTGKSQLALDLLAQLTNHGVRFVFFDMKGELEDDPNSPQQRKNRTQFLEQTHASYVRLIQQDLPINPLYRHPNPTQNAQVAYEIANLIRCFAPQLGAIQERNICDAYQRLPEPSFSSLALELENSGARGVDLSIVQKIERFNLFASAHTAIPPEEWLNNSMVIDFKEFGTDNDTKALAVALILNFLIKKLNQQVAVKNDIQPIKMVLFVDEAHLLLPKENKAGLLSQLARQGRSWGFPVWLASQDADKFLTTGTNEANFAELAECGVHFSPHTLNPADQKLILGGVIHQKFKKAEAALRLQGKLQTGMARQFWKDEGK
ncbi:MAG: DndE family protein [Deltaproteobacteria bacterium]|nr:DndE family protein [Deltaproteobacteria bacterium]